MEVAATVIILLHPLSALTVIWLFVNQRKWRQTSLKIKGTERKKAVENHEKNGNKLFFYVIGVILLAFISKIFLEVSMNCSNSFSETLPLLISLDLILDCSERILVESCSEDISREKKATDDFIPFFSIFFAA